MAAVLPRCDLYNSSLTTIGILAIFNSDLIPSGAQLAREEDLGDLAREARLSKAMTQQEAADALGVRQPTIAQAEAASARSLRALRTRMIETFGSYRVDGPFWLLVPKGEDAK